MIPTRLFFQIHDLRRLLMMYSLNEFLRGHFVSFCIVFLECSSFYFHPELYRFLDHCFSVSSSFILLLNIKHQCHWRNKRTISPECTKNGGSAPPEKKNCNSLDRTQFRIDTSILLRFPQRLVIHDSRAEVQRFMILQF